MSVSYFLLFKPVTGDAMVSLFWGSSWLAGLLEFGLGGFLVSGYLDSQCLELMFVCGYDPSWK